MINVFIFLSAILFWALFFIWDTSNWTNRILKMAFGSMGVFGLVIALQLSGYIVKVN